MNKWNTLLNEVKTEVNRLQIENKFLAYKNFELIVRNTTLTGTNLELKKELEASKELNNQLILRYIDITKK